MYGREWCIDIMSANDKCHGAPKAAERVLSSAIYGRMVSAAAARASVVSLRVLLAASVRSHPGRAVYARCCSSESR